MNHPTHLKVLEICHFTDTLRQELEDMEVRLVDQCARLNYHHIRTGLLNQNKLKVIW